MKPWEIKINDWIRIVLGEVPVTFIIELIIRAAAVYLILMLSMRMMGKRMSSQLSRNELAALVSLAAAVGVPMMAPDRGLLPAVVIAIVLISVERLIARWAYEDQSFEKFSQGNISVLIKNGVVDVGVLTQTNLSRERLFAQLRKQGVKQLGGITRFYMEANGGFTLIENGSPVPGLGTFPAWDEEIMSCYEFDDKTEVCGFCGQPQPAGDKKSQSECPNCGKEVWMPAVKKVKF